MVNKNDILSITLNNDLVRSSVFFWVSQVLTCFLGRYFYASVYFSGQYAFLYLFASHKSLLSETGLGWNLLHHRELVE